MMPGYVVGVIGLSDVLRSWRIPIRNWVLQLMSEFNLTLAYRSIHACFACPVGGVVESVVWCIWVVW